MKNSGSYDNDMKMYGNARHEIIADSRSLNELELMVGNMNEITAIEKPKKKSISKCVGENAAMCLVNALQVVQT